MFIKKHLIWNILKRIHIPVVIIAFLFTLLHLHNRESVRILEALKAAEEAILSAAPIVPVVEDLGNFQATAYSITGITKSGVPVMPGHVAADPRVIPLGSVIYVESSLMCGIYQVMDTGGLVKGRTIDIFMSSYKKCIEFGRRRVKVKVLRYGYGDDSIRIRK